MPSIDALSADDFKDRVGQSFTLAGGPVTLKEVKTGTPGHKRFRAPFSLIFEAESALEDTTGLAALDHPDLGALDLLYQRIAPLDEDNAAPTYEIVLN